MLKRWGSYIIKFLTMSIKTFVKVIVALILFCNGFEDIKRVLRKHPSTEWISKAFNSNLEKWGPDWAIQIVRVELKGKLNQWKLQLWQAQSQNIIEIKKGKIGILQWFLFANFLATTMKVSVGIIWTIFHQNCITMNRFEIF